MLGPVPCARAARSRRTAAASASRCTLTPDCPPDVSAPHPSLLDPRSLPRRVLVVAPHPDDEVLGCGGLAALLARSGAEVRVLVLTDGARGAEPAAQGPDLVARREAEARAGGAALGVKEHVFLSLPDGALGAQHDLVLRLRAEFARSEPELVLAPSPLETHADHRAASRAACSAAADGSGPGGRGRKLLLYGVDVPVVGVERSVHADVTEAMQAKRTALACHASQTARHDFASRAVEEGARAARAAGLPAGRSAEAFVQLDGAEAPEWSRAVLERALGGVPRTTAVVSTWNKRADLESNVDALRAQTLPFAEIVVVDNASRDGTAAFVKERYPEVRLIEMPHDRFGACTTFNLGFRASRTELTAILDDDIVMPPNWLEKATTRMQSEPPTTAIVSTQVTEPGMPAGYLASERHNTERYMSTFRGCASLARAKALEEAEYYDERLFIYGNERDLTCRLLNRGYRVLQYPGCGVFHKTPFGIKMGKRSLYYHARNAWLSMLKYAPLSDLARMPWLVLTRVLLRGSKKEAEGAVADATGTIGIGKSVRETPGAWWILVKASGSILANVPYCLKHRRPVRAPDFELPLQ
ncbi:MAG: PIG-L family deacetylase [Planctomycetes bacterium]|nr:PIG-L family deacetylase [Planctomycetota bacterium]